jgi:hypothetical protein
MRMKNKYSKETQKWIDSTKTAYNIFKSMPLKDLKRLGDLSGLDMNHYKTKSLLAKGIMIRLGAILPVEFDKWK